MDKLICTYKGKCFKGKKQCNVCRYYKLLQDMIESEIIDDMCYG